jgi:hypothetical protein
VLARDEASGEVSSIPVRVAAWFAMNGDPFARRPPMDAVVRNVAKHKVAAIVVGPAWTLDEPETTCELLDYGCRADKLGKGWSINVYDCA